MADKDSQSNPAHNTMKDASMGTLGQVKKDFYWLLLKNAITQQSILFVPILFDEIDIEYNQPFAKVTMYHLNIG